MSLRGGVTGRAGGVAVAGGVGLGVEPFERLLMPPAGAIRQAEVDGCGPACLEMALALEHRGAGSAARTDQSSLAVLCRGMAAVGYSAHPMRWASSPAALQSVLNAHGPEALPAGRRQHYHVVHAAAARGPLEEILSWIRGPHTASGPLALPSFLLTRHGTHWMLVVGARVDDEGLVWLAAADPGSGRLLGLTTAGVQAEFTPNLVGTHPDWTGRHVAVIPSVLPRQRPGAPGGSGAVTAATAAASPEAAPTDDFHSPEMAGKDFTVNARSDADAAAVLNLLSDFAEQAGDPLAVRWLAPLRQARHLIDPDHPAGSRGSAVAGNPRRAWVVDALRRPVAEVTLRGAPAAVLHFTVLDKRPAASEP
jgi:hypothetical protein